MNLIAAAVEPLRAKAIARAEEYAREIIDRAYAELAAAGWDLNKVAPRAKSTMNRRDYKMAQNRRNFFGQITSIVKTSYSNLYQIEKEFIVEPNEQYAQRFIAEAGADSNAQFDEYIVKLTEKVGEVDEASINAYGVWSYSHLTVRKGDEVEVWHTQQIVNTSSLGKPFNQWPTRKLKNKEAAA